MIFRDPKFLFSDLTFQPVQLIQNKESVHIRYYAYARQALDQICELKGINKGDRILVPAFICRAAVEPFAVRGIEIGYYRLTDDFRADYVDLKQLMSERVKAVLYVNYFGLCPFDEGIRKFCDENKILLIEDNAHTLPEKFERMYGDFTVYSLRKMIPCPDGAVLVFSKKESQPGGYFPVSPIWGVDDFKYILGQTARRFYSLVENERLNQRLLNRRKQKAVSPNGHGDSFRGCVMSRLSAVMLHPEKLQAVYRRRRELYELVFRSLDGKANNWGRYPFTAQVDGFAPLAFPVLVEDGREKLEEYLFLHGFVCYSWPDLPEEVRYNKFFIREQRLAEQMLLLPVHQSMDKKDIERLIGLLEGYQGYASTH